MSDDWRVNVRLTSEDHAGELIAALHEKDVEDDVRQRLGGRLAVSVGDDRRHVFVYADSDAAATEAERIVQGIFQAHDLSGRSRVERWHHVEEEWEDAGVPLPTSGAEVEVEHARLEQEESAESAGERVAEWELRIEFASHRDARAFEDRLEREGFSHLVRRWRFVLVGMDDRDDATAWAERLKAELPAGATIEVEPGSGVVWEFVPKNPFAVFGGLAG